MKNLIRIGLLALLPFFASAQIAWPDVATQDQLRKTNARIDSLNFAISGVKPGNPVRELPDCPKGPVIEKITKITNTGAEIVFDGEGVYKIDWRVMDVQDTTKLHSFGTVEPTTSKFTIVYAGLAPGQYRLNLTSVLCKGSGSRNFTVPYSGGREPVTPDPATPAPTPATGSREIFMNTTGYGFDPYNETGIDQQWRKRIEAFRTLKYSGVVFSGITGVRLAVPWHLYEPKKGQFRDNEIRAAMAYLKSRGLKIAVCLLPLRKEGDGYLNTEDIAVSATGRVWKFGGDHTMSAASIPARNALKEAARRLTQVIYSDPAFAGYVQLGYSHTEEFYMPVVEEGHKEPVGYAKADLDAWKKFAPGVPVQIPGAYEEDWQVGNFWNGGSGRKWFEFQTSNLAAMFAAFRDGVHEAGGKVCGYFADAGAAQSARGFTYDLDKIFQGSDYVYSTEGANGWDLSSKLMAADLIRGTFPKAGAIIEFDPADVAHDIVPPGTEKQDGPMNWNVFYTYGSSLFRRGVKIISLAMSFSDGSSGPDNISYSAEHFWKLKNEFIGDKVITPLPITLRVRQEITQYSDHQPYRWEWKKSGGDLETVVPIILNPSTNPNL
jgi:hypothetical protein